MNDQSRTQESQRLPLVSICTLTYNHEKFIRQTVESLLMQETNFPYEVVISDDGSTDGTVKIIKDLITSHPNGNLIKLLTHENMGVLPNYIFTFKQCNGKYIAFCEGDDYWTNKNKLQIQFDFLEENPDFSICFHQVRKMENESFVSNAPDLSAEKEYKITDLAKHPLMYTPSVMMKFNEFSPPEWYIESPLFDYPLQLLIARTGKIKYLPLNMADYRVGTGLWTSGHGLKNTQKLVKLMTLLMKEFSSDDELFSIFSERRSEYEKMINEHNFYLDIYSGKVNLDKISVRSSYSLLLKKLRSKLK